MEFKVGGHISVTNKRGIRFIFKINPITLKANKLSFCSYNLNTIFCAPLKTNVDLRNQLVFSITTWEPDEVSPK